MNVLGVIPARWASTRFEGKVLAAIAGKPMLQHVWERASKSELLNDLIVACDDDNVKMAVEQFGGEALMTSSDHPSGTDRIIEVLETKSADVVVNIQADEPLIEHSIIDSLANVFANDDQCLMATAIKKIDNEDELNDPNIVKVVKDNNDNALYFSRSMIPYNRDEQEIVTYKHLGIYAYRASFLKTIQTLPPSTLEIAERLEQLRILQAGYAIKTIETSFDTMGVDVPEDVQKVEALLK